MPIARAGRAAIGVLAAIGGLLLLVWQVRQAGADQVTANLLRVGPWFAAILALSLGRFLSRTLAWQALIGEKLPMLRALGATIAGDGLGNLLPLGLLVSEPAKALLLRGPVSASRAMAALAAENFFYSISVALYIVVGTTAMLLAFAIGDELRWLAAAFLGSMGVVLAGAWWLARKQPQVVSATLARIPIARLRSIAARVRELETGAYGAIAPDRGRLRAVAGWETLFHISSFAECWLLVYLLTGASMPAAALVLDTFSRVVNIVFKMVPLKLGVDEVTSESVAVAVGLATGLGTTMALVRKARVFIWALVGLGVLASSRRQ